MGRNVRSGRAPVLDGDRPGQVRTSYANRSTAARLRPDHRKIFQRNAMRSSNALSSGHPEPHRRRGTSPMRWAFDCFYAPDHKARIVLCLVRVTSSQIEWLIATLGMTRLRNGVARSI